ncbi:Fructokinase [hydrothermal vent metagenome]|uniref:Fructokinase n=1 Tax=hydrothermal vent metagenome TaxID=652676 RepID=A0A3B0Z7P5_9ZZZZ
MTMNQKPRPALFKPIIFGEVLFDCFPGGEQRLGGAPFNLAWHLHALGNQPCLISRVGNDDLGKKITREMTTWGMDTTGLQKDNKHATGQVSVKIIENEPSYNIVPDCAYDFIEYQRCSTLRESSLLYHGSLALRNSVSRSALQKIIELQDTSIFLDVNLRTPWWHKEEVLGWLKRARWAKVNEDELVMLAGEYNDLENTMLEFQRENALQLLFVTLGEKGAVVLSDKGERYQVVPKQRVDVIDTVGAGDAFTAVLLHGLIHDWSLSEMMECAQKFASKIVGIRGGTVNNRDFYQSIMTVKLPL